MSARLFIFHMSIPCDETFPWVPLFFTLWPGHLTHFLKTYLANNFWTVSARAVIFHMIIPCDKTFPWVLLFCLMWLWPWCLSFYLANNLYKVSFDISHEHSLWEDLSGNTTLLTLWPWPWSLTWFFLDLTLLITFKQYVLELSYLHEYFMR